MNKKMRGGLTGAFFVAALFGLDIAYLRHQNAALSDKIREDGYKPLSVKTTLFGKDSFTAEKADGTVVTGTDNTFLGTPHPTYSVAAPP